MTCTEKKILKVRDVLEVTKLSRTTLYRKIKAGEFPRQVMLGKQAVGWFECEVQCWLSNLHRKW